MKNNKMKNRGMKQHGIFKKLQPVKCQGKSG